MEVEHCEDTTPTLKIPVVHELGDIERLRVPDPHEQTGYLLRGHLRLCIGNETFEARPGDSWCIPDGIEHGAQILEDSVAVEVFSPIREDYLPEAT